MATICMSYCLIVKSQGVKEHRIISSPKTLIPFSCQSSNKSGEDDSKAKKAKTEKPPLQVLSGVSELGRKLKENLSPKQKGDWKDVLLMSLSFGVYVYISQKIVCAYCAWMSMLDQTMANW